MTVVFMPTIHDEVGRLLADAEEYFRLFGEDDMQRLRADLRPQYETDTARITLRLSAIVAWCMVQKAVLKGKLTPEQAAKEYGLAHREVCLAENRHYYWLPAYVSYLLGRSLELYERVDRLDQQSRERTTGRSEAEVA